MDEEFYDYERPPPFGIAPGSICICFKPGTSLKRCKKILYRYHLYVEAMMSDTYMMLGVPVNREMEIVELLRKVPEVLFVEPLFLSNYEFQGI